MLIQVDGDDVRVVKHMEEDKPKIVCILDRVREELEGFILYKHMARKSARYATPSMQEFQHMLLAWDDFVTELHGLMSPEEKQEFHKFTKSIQNTTATATTNTQA